MNSIYPQLFCQHGSWRTATFSWTRKYPSYFLRNNMFNFVLAFTINIKIMFRQFLDSDG